MSYRFPLQRLLDLRHQHERAMARDLAHARDAMSTEEEAHDALVRAQEQAQDRITRETAEQPTVGTLLSLGHALRHLDAHIELAHERLRAADAVVQQRHDALTVAAQARQILDRLRSRHELEFRSEANARDLQTMDEIALTRFAQPDDAPMNRNRTNR
jgi:flagellar FliJ protein